MRQETRKEEIIRVAAQLFKEKGYSAVTMRDLARSLGIKAASLYNHINSKQDLLKFIIISLAEEFTVGMNKIMSLQCGSIDRIRKIIALHVDIAGRNTAAMASLNNDWMHLEDQLQYYLSLRQNYEDNFRKIIVEGIQSGELKDIRPDVMLFSVLSTLRSLYLWMPSKEDLNPDELAMELCEILIDGINKDLK